MSTPEYKPTASQAELDAMVNRRKIAQEQRGIEPPDPVIAPKDESKTVAMEVMRQFGAGFGLKIVSEAQLEEEAKKALEFGKNQAAMLEQQNRLKRWENLTPPEFRKEWDWSLCAGNREEIQRILNWQPKGGGLFIVGETGKTKSRAVYRMLKGLIIDQGMEPMVMTGTQFATQASAMFAAVDQTDRWLTKMAKVPLLFIDDFGKRLTKSAEEAFFDILDRRTSWHRPLLITTNYDSDDMTAISQARGEAAQAADLMGPIFRRIVEYLELVTV